MDRKRLDELDRQIVAARRRYGEAFLVARSNALNDEAEAHRGPSCRAAEQARERALSAAVDLLLAKRENVAAGLPEDSGIALPVDLEAVVGAQLTALRKEFEHRFETFRREVQNGLARVVPKMVEERLRSFEDRAQAIESSASNTHGKDLSR